ncbi:MAG: hypothetical protein KGQ75_09910 [Sphingomonadales bacterium]|nr:hypothetical protein [Sphingomonadales bacterium]
MAALAVVLPQPALANPASVGASTTIEDPVGSVVLDQPIQLLTTSFNLLVIGPSVTSNVTSLSSSSDSDRRKKQEFANSDLQQQSVYGDYNQNDSNNLRNPIAYSRFGSFGIPRLSLILLQFN